ncbi:MAG: hypothetical protein NVSMB10_15740 [Steroidobacteraceae bacterium]
MGFAVSVVVLDAEDESDAAGVVVFGMSAAIAAAAKPSVSKAEVIKVPGLFIESPNDGVLTVRRKNTPDP